MDAEVQRLLSEDCIDVDVLRTYVREHGLRTTEERRIIYPLLLNVSLAHSHDTFFSKGNNDPIVSALFPSHLVAPTTQLRRQIHLDAIRTFSDFPVSTAEKYTLRLELEQLLNAIFSRNPRLHYYQGYNDICAIFLLIFGRDYALPLLERISTTFLFAFHEPSFNTVAKIMALQFPLISLYLPELYYQLLSTKVSEYYSLPSILTWFVHNLVFFIYPYLFFCSFCIQVLP